MSIIIGFLIVVAALILIRNEFTKSLDLRISKLGDFSDVEKRKIVEVLEELEDEINNLNKAFYEIVNDLEGKYSIHEKQLEMIEKKLKRISTIKNEVEIKYENKINAEINIPNDEISIKNKIIKMRAENMSINEIAKELQMGVGELKLLLNINKNSN
ncbi:hypothetical protein QUF55_00195 [Clostridiaceae bacterium HSG29]|nr:hypothetical protein [Clostridiaceae bacterium HSG29]